MHEKSDISKNSLISILPNRLQSWLILLRIDRPIGWWLLVLPAWWAILQSSIDVTDSIKLILIFTIGSILMRGAGCIINDLWDRKLDQEVMRTLNRPLANGDISIIEAFLGLLIILIISFCILTYLPIYAILVGLSSIPLIIIYPLAKRFTMYPQIVLGVVFSWGVPLGWFASNQSFQIEIIYLYFGTIAWVFGYDSIYSIQDIKDDKRVGIHSTAITFGVNLKTAISISYIIALFFWFLSFSSLYWFVGLFIVGIHMIWQVSSIDLNNYKLALKLFKSNRDLGLILAFACILEKILH